MIGELEISRPVARKPRRRFHVDRLPFLPRLMAGMMRLIHGSCRFTILGQEHEEATRNFGSPVIYTTWHFAYPAVVYHFRDRNAMLMVSRSRDGEWMARVLSYLGFQTARGSPEKGGGLAIRHLIAHVRNGYIAGFIADGSRGPALVAQRGILILASHTQTPLVPVSMAANPCWRFRSWDRTILAKPFATVAFAYGAPIMVDRGASPELIEEIRIRLQDSMNELTRKCEEALDKKGRVLS